MTHDEKIAELRRKRDASDRAGQGYKARIEAIDREIARLEQEADDERGN